MADISEIHEKVLAFLLDWRAKRDPGLTFYLDFDGGEDGPRPGSDFKSEDLENGLWFGSNWSYVGIYFWRGLWSFLGDLPVNIGFEINPDGTSRLSINTGTNPSTSSIIAKIAERLNAVPAFTATHIRGSSTSVNIEWIKEYDGVDYVSNLSIY